MAVLSTVEVYCHWMRDANRSTERFRHMTFSEFPPPGGAGRYLHDMPAIVLEVFHEEIKHILS